MIDLVQRILEADDAQLKSRIGNGAIAFFSLKLQSPA